MPMNENSNGDHVNATEGKGEDIVAYSLIRDSFGQLFVVYPNGTVQPARVVKPLVNKTFYVPGVWAGSDTPPTPILPHTHRSVSNALVSLLPLMMRPGDSRYSQVDSTYLVRQGPIPTHFSRNS